MLLINGSHGILSIKTTPGIRRISARDSFVVSDISTGLIHPSVNGYAPFLTKKTLMEEDNLDISDLRWVSRWVEEATVGGRYGELYLH